MRMFFYEAPAEIMQISRTCMYKQLGTGKNPLLYNQDLL